MGIFDFLTGTKKPKAGTPVLAKDEVIKKLLNLNRPTSPYQVIQGTEGYSDLIAEWKIVDAQWYEIFAKAGISKVFRIYLKFHDEQSEIRALDKEYSVEWKIGIPSLSESQAVFIGQKHEIEFGKAYAFTENSGYGQVYQYRFSTDEIKKPIQDIVVESGWTYHGIVPPASL